MYRSVSQAIEFYYSYVDIKPVSTTREKQYFKKIWKFRFWIIKPKTFISPVLIWYCNFCVSLKIKML